MFAITMAGGANVRVVKESLSFSPMFLFKSLTETAQFVEWVAKHFHEIKTVAESTTRHGRLLEIVPYCIGRRVILDFRYNTGDAMGLNMVSIATATACNYILEHTGAENFYLASNLSSDKKPSYFNLITGYGKEVSVDVEFTKDVMVKYFGVEPEEIYTYWCNAFLGAHVGGMMSFNCHFANALAALYIACGQDVAQIVNASVGITHSELTAAGGFRVSLRLPGIIIGTVGGGTMSGTAKECLELLGCSGSNKSLKFAEIIGATLLAGEVAIGAAIASNTFIKAHIRRRNASKSIEKKHEYAEA
jgi:hydroxymethylglutaryl-CoA reductase (NADPH)